MTPFGSLATLLWLHVLAKKGVKMGFWNTQNLDLLLHHQFYLWFYYLFKGERKIENKKFYLYSANTTKVKWHKRCYQIWWR